ncbi:hypothetical protein [Candidatus Endomicrobiellum agilis]|uniref:hypothetical protein n=1 Tax=Candidatus Endomicrobiellum agilis TaxID=3238957 RepID=UPI0035787EF2|nr:hypothetical protein [Endomicrobium sp.]
MSLDLEIVKFGPGFSYLFPVSDGEESFSYLPIYFTIQVNPFINVLDEYLHGLFVKGNIGYNALFDFENKDYNEYKFDKSGGLYCGISAGYEFPFGLLFDLGYYMYKSSMKTGVGTFDFTCTSIICNAAFKVKV